MWTELPGKGSCHCCLWGRQRTVPHWDDSNYTIYTGDTAGLMHKHRQDRGLLTWAPCNRGITTLKAILGYVRRELGISLGFLRHCLQTNKRKEKKNWSACHRQATEVLMLEPRHPPRKSDRKLQTAKDVRTEMFRFRLRTAAAQCAVKLRTYRCPAHITIRPWLTVLASRNFSRSSLAWMPPLPAPFPVLGKSSAHMTQGEGLWTVLGGNASSSLMIRFCPRE